MRGVVNVYERHERLFGRGSRCSAPAAAIIGAKSISVGTVSVVGRCGCEYRSSEGVFW